MRIEKSAIFKIGFAIIVILVAGIIFASLAEDLVNRETLSTLDPLFGTWLVARTTLPGDQIFALVTFLGNALIISAGTGLIGFWLVRKKNWKKLHLLFFAVTGGALLNLALKNIFQRTRPAIPGAYMTETGFSFPSGHSMISLVFYGMVAYLALSYVKSKKWKAFIVAGALAICALIGISRLYLGVHFLTDVLAGWAAGGLWLALCILGDFWQQNIYFRKTAS
jgi:membrane-associated phospholipid phosphatase